MNEYEKRHTHVMSIVPVPKPRMTQADRWKKRKCVLRYRDFCDEVRACSEGFRFPAEGARITFLMPIPKSVSKKERERRLHMPHQQKPDLDNLIKSLLDALEEEDKHIWQFSARKVWSDKGMIIIETDVA